jgi:hypothetical protein
MRKVFTLLFASICSVSFAQNAQKTSAAFTTGNLVVYRVGDGSAALTSSATAIFLDEYSPTGTLVQSVALPTATSGSNNPITASGTATSEGFITRSTNGSYLVFTGYNAVPTTTTPNTSTTITRIVGRIDNAGNINTTTSLTPDYQGSNIRAVASDNGTNIWTSGTASSAANGGVHYTTLGSTTGTQVSSSVTNTRAIAIFNGQLYITSSSGAFRMAAVGTGLPNTTGQTIVNLPNFTTSTGSPYGFFFADLNSSIPGVDVLYVADDGSGTGIQKYSFDGTNWNANGNISTVTTTRGLTGVVSGSTVTLYTVNGTGLYSLVDNTGYNATITASPTLLASAPTNTAFRGVAFSPLASTPLSLNGFSGSVVNNHTVLNWSTVNENNVNGFTIEKSFDGQNYSPLSLVNAKNGTTNTYNYTDAVAISKLTYYRLKMTDKDGSFKYSNVVAVNGKSSVHLEVFPNPASSTMLISHPQADAKAVVKIVAADGRTVASYNVQQGATQSSIDVSKLPAGNYVAVFEGANGSSSATFVKF